jgi:hypothetical protein
VRRLLLRVWLEALTERVLGTVAGGRALHAARRFARRVDRSLSRVRRIAEGRDLRLTGGRPASSWECSRFDVRFT